MDIGLTGDLLGQWAPARKRKHTMGRHLASAADNSNQTITVLAETALAAGDYARLGAGGYVRRAADGVPLALQNAAAGVTALVPAAAAESSGAGAWGRTGFGNQGFRSVLALDNGHFAVVFSGNGAVNDTGVNLRIYGPMRVPVSPRVVVATAAGVGCTRLARAGISGIAVAWTEGSVLKLAIHATVTGALAAAETTVATLGAADIASWNMATLAGGEVVLAYRKSGSNDLVFKRFDALGAAQGGEVTVESGASPTYLGVLPLAAGGFVLHYYRSAATAAYKFARFAANGSPQGGLATLATGPAYRSASPCERNAIELGNGNIAFVDPSSSTVAGVRLYDAGGNFLSAIVAAPDGGPNSVCICPRQFGGFWLAAGGRMHEYDNGGNSLRQVVGAGSTPSVMFDRAGNGPLVAVYYSGEGHNVQLAGWLADLSTMESSLIVSTSSSYALSYVWTEVLSNGMLVSIVCPQSSSAQLHLSIPQAASILGIVQEPAAPGTAARVATAGKFMSTQSFNGPAFDRRSATPPGTRGVAVGNMAILGGVSG